MVKQNGGRDDCALVAIANLLGLTYQETYSMYKDFFPEGSFIKTGVSSFYVGKFLKELGIFSHCAEDGSYNNIFSLTKGYRGILIWYTDLEHGHGVYCDGVGVYDNCYYPNAFKYLNSYTDENISIIYYCIKTSKWYRFKSFLRFLLTK